tara:strand:+ start:122 stop:457 length:336 start_codon:yes stop_codon:yes gene_type:complete
MDNDKKINILIGISLSAATIYLLNAYNYIDLKFCIETKNTSTQHENKENESSAQYSIKDINNDKNSKEIVIDDNLKKDIDIIEKDELNNQDIKKKLCLLNYIYNLSNFTKS